MTDHTRAVRLTATALDFTLTPEERLELEMHRAECVICRQVDLDLRSDAEALRRLPRRDASTQLWQTIADAAWRGEQPRSRTGLILLVAAILMLAMAIGGGIAASQWLERDDGVTQRTDGAPNADYPSAVEARLVEDLMISILNSE